jgi:hypothetical protein
MCTKEGIERKRSCQDVGAGWVDGSCDTKRE